MVDTPQTVAPVHVLSFLVLGSEKDAKSLEVLHSFKIQYILNVTPKCPNYFEDQNVTYMRVAVSDTGSQKLSQHFKEAFEYIDQARKNKCNILIHCMAGISRSATMTIGYLMYRFGMTLQEAHQYVKEKRPTINPNLNFMGQLVELETELKQFPAQEKLELSQFLPATEQEKLSVCMQTPEPKPTKHFFSSSAKGVGGSEVGPEGSHAAPFVLKLPAPRHKKGLRKKPTSVTPHQRDHAPIVDAKAPSSSPSSPFPT